MIASRRRARASSASSLGGLATPPSAVRPQAFPRSTRSCWSPAPRGPSPAPSCAQGVLVRPLSSTDGQRQTDIEEVPRAEQSEVLGGPRALRARRGASLQSSNRAPNQPRRQSPARAGSMPSGNPRHGHALRPKLSEPMNKRRRASTTDPEAMWQWMATRLGATPRGGGSRLSRPHAASQSVECLTG
jgi:hypothetical protein